MSEDFIPPFPVPHKTKSSSLKRLWLGLSSWIHVLYEKSYTLKLGEVNMRSHDLYVVGEPNLVDRVLVDEPENFPKHTYLLQLLGPLVGNSVFTSNGEEWKEQRTMLNAAFSHTNLQRSFDNMIDAADAIVDSLRQDVKDSASVGIDPYMMHVTADIIYRTILSRSLTQQEALVIYEAFHRYQIYAQRSFILSLYKLPHGFFMRRAKKEGKTIRGVFHPYIKERYDVFHALGTEEQTSLKEKDFLDAMLKARHPETGRVFNVDEMLDQFTQIFLAGHETSASTLTWALYLIAKMPELQEEIYQEIEQVTTEEGFTHKSVRALEQTRYLFQEALRLYPPVSFFLREAATDTEMRDKKIAQGSIMVVSPWLIQRSSNHWKNPHAFDPQRFNRNNEAAQSRCPAHKDSLSQGYLPFGKGQRICVGAGFAQQEAIIILAKILQAFRITYTQKREPEPVSRVTTRAKHGIVLAFESRD